MRAKNVLRALLAAVVTIAVATVLVVALIATDTMLAIWERLDKLSPWATTVYALLLLLLATLTGGGVWRLLTAAKRVPERSRATALTRAQLEAQIASASTRGVDAQASRNELNRLQERQREAVIYIAMFGQMSVGKSSLIGALLPEATLTVDARGGTTQDVRYYRWQRNNDLPVKLVDLPGFGHAKSAYLTTLAREEALRAHLVLYVCDGDLTQEQHSELTQLAEYRKPIVVVLNKADRYDTVALSLVKQHLIDKLVNLSAVSVVAVSAGGSEELVHIDGSGEERTVERQRPTNIQELVSEMQRILSTQETELAQNREASILRLAAGKLTSAEERFLAHGARTLIDRYAKRAVLGALAAVTPGSDLVIQGALAAKLLHELCTLYGMPANKIDIDDFIAAAGGRVRKSTAITLAIAGNALKAFPGVGTLAGGAVHAIAYGMIFQSLGEAAAQSLAQHGAIATPAIEQFEERLVEHLETRAGRFARLALAQIRDREKAP